MSTAWGISTGCCARSCGDGGRYHKGEDMLMLSEAYLDEIESTWLDASEHDIQQFRELSTKKFFDLAGQHIRDLLTEIRYLQRALVSPLRVWFMTYEIHDENGRVAGP